MTRQVLHEISERYHQWVQNQAQYHGIELTFRNSAGRQPFIPSRYQTRAATLPTPPKTGTASSRNPLGRALACGGLQSATF